MLHVFGRQAHQVAAQAKKIVAKINFTTIDSSESHADGSGPDEGRFCNLGLNSRYSLAGDATYRSSFSGVAQWHESSTGTLTGTLSWGNWLR